MLTKLIIKNFKGTPDCSIELDQAVVFVGPNNSGKTTALQALSLWETGLHSWMTKRTTESTAKERSGVTINRRDLISIPVANSRFLWKKQKVRRGKTDESKKSNTENVRIEISVEIAHREEHVVCEFEFDFANSESIYCRPIQRETNTFLSASQSILEMLRHLRIAFLPPMSGLASFERKLEQGSIDVLIGEGQTAQVLRNLCYSLYLNVDTDKKWPLLTEEMKTLFGITLHEPQYDSVRGEISMYYHEEGDTIKEKLELSSAGRGLQQTLLILAFLYLHPGSVIMLDEPDAHLEILRQKRIYEIIKRVAREQQGQVIAVTHSEVILNESAQKDTVIAFIGKPHRLNDKSQLVKALGHYGWDQYFLAKQKGWVLYLEGSSDLDMLRSFADLLKHPVAIDLESPFFVPMCNNLPKTAEAHFHAIKEAWPNLTGYALFDKISDTQVKNIRGLKERTLKRRELENYFCTKDTLINWARSYSEESFMREPLFERVLHKERDGREKIMLECISEYEKLYIQYQKKADSLWSDKLKASDDVLQPIMQRFFECLERPSKVHKSKYCELIAFLGRDNIDSEIIEILGQIHDTANKAKLHQDNI